MAILKANTIATMIIPVVFIFSIAVISISAAYSVNATRDLPDSVSSGDSFNVTVSFTAPADNFNAIGLTEVANKTANMTVEGKKEWCTPKADFCKVTDNKLELLWYGPYDADTAFTVIYRVNVPSDAKGDSHAFNGSVEYYIGEEGPYKEAMEGDKEVKVITTVPSEEVVSTPMPTLTPTPSPTPALTPTPTPEVTLLTPTLTPEVTPTPLIPTPSPTPPSSRIPTPTPKSPGLEAVFAIAVILSVAYLTLRRNGNK